MNQKDSASKISNVIQYVRSADRFTVWSFTLFLVAILAVYFGGRTDYYYIRLMDRSDLTVTASATPDWPPAHRGARPMPVAYELTSSSYVLELGIDPEYREPHIIVSAFTNDGQSLLVNFEWAGRCGDFESVPNREPLAMPSYRASLIWKPTAYCSGTKYETRAEASQYPFRIEVLDSNGDTIGTEDIQFYFAKNGSYDSLASL